MQPSDTTLGALPTAARSIDPSRWNGWLIAAAILALVLPTVVFHHYPPVTIATQQISGATAWGVFLLAVAWQAPRFQVQGIANREVLYALAALGLVFTMTWVSVVHFDLPVTIAMDMSAMLLCAALAMATGHLAAGSQARDQIVTAFMLGLMLMGALSAAIAVTQFFFPQLTNGVWLSPAHLTGRAAGNVGQPNHLSTLTVWALVAVMWWRQQRGLHLGLLILGTLVAIVTVLLSGSRTGMLCLIGLMLWAAIDDGLDKKLRVVMLSSPIVWFIGWWLARRYVTAPASLVPTPDAFQRFTDSQSSGNRFGIWLNSLELLAANPLGGTGAWLFNHKWVLSPVAGRPPELFDNAHNIFVNIVTEYGIPAGFLLVGLLVRMFWVAITAPGKASSPSDSATLKMIAAMLAAIALHSQLESPLVNVYFLLPTAFLLGLALSWRALLMSRLSMMDLNLPELSARRAVAMRSHRIAQAGAALMVAGGVSFAFDYAKVEPAFVDPSSTGFNERLERAQSSWFFSHHAHHLRMTTPGVEKLPDTAAIASRTLINYSVLTNWAGMYEKDGDTDRAYHLLQRMREMNPYGMEKMYGLCSTLEQFSPPNEDLPLHCRRPTKRLGPQDFP